MLKVIIGPMFAGKTEELIRRYRRLEYAVPKVCLSAYKPKRDVRSSAITTHYGDFIAAAHLETMSALDHDQTDHVFIDEFQFADPAFVDVILRMVGEGVDITVAGLPLDSRGRPFGPMASILPHADDITFLTAICRKCGDDATKTQRLKEEGDTVMVGGSDKYEARCPLCWEAR